MDPNTPADFFQGSSKFHTYYSHTKKGGGVIDLGLSLRTIQHETYLPSGQMIGVDGYGDLIDWSQTRYSSNTQLKSEETRNRRLSEEYYNDEKESRRKLNYVKVNLDGLVVGRKVCLLSQGNYSTLALQLDDMFGMQTTVSGLRLFQTESEFSLVYRDMEGIWRNVGDVPWKEFVESVDRMRIARRNHVLPPF
ncbi:PREDICTED: auxin-responsive protein IAA32-like isoform X1 [Camelina sativa]|uniref:Auxin-responsive protein n=2 Tax=Camelina sativa TaxID=90675 RepID=A0ABM1RLR9_CAMSA|nr:PREDICTED: auxin-responsive protein IAA32-like isoform X1 [Camelina sativa]XP_019099957.1 PREDICTED: auxin-responsive protein IAA32-like isoform X1 [Camelina sativa]XP_019099958.1 PREDICTED: auxin-responsive protein IAA32-like isoform X1 [Camelina sativa]XP_019099959.1 PREDICTED: auxin-responsive protein IAA32-like isoform X1 [Camelina sativa]XP_019099960.1 PREDICTED: auxin-responsive protein IAA32-like isoform X1 [Camelina sativa]